MRSEIKARRGPGSVVFAELKQKIDVSTNDSNSSDTHRNPQEHRERSTCGETFTRTKTGWTVARQYVGTPDTWSQQHPVDLNAPPPGPTLIKLIHCKVIETPAPGEEPCSLCGDECLVICSRCIAVFGASGPLRREVVAGIRKHLLDLGERRRANVLSRYFLRTSRRKSKRGQSVLTPYRKHRRMSQRELAAEWGVTQQAISKMERGYIAIPKNYGLTIAHYMENLQKRGRQKKAKYNQSGPRVQGRLYSGISDPKNQTLTNAVKADLGPPVSLSEAEGSDDYDDEPDECAVG